MSEQAFFSKDQVKPKILVAPLEWGLGHATRCIPIIKELVSLDCQVFIAAEGSTRSLLEDEFPTLTFLDLRGYRVKYSRKKQLLLLKLFTQIPKIIYTVFNENRWLKVIARKYNLDAVISDNRFGMYNRHIKSIYITHQVNIKSGSKSSSSIASRIHQFFIKKYDYCWIPDYQTSPGLAGEMSHITKDLKNVFYIGCLSRLVKLQNVEKKYDLVCSISGPEPQRTIFEKLIVDQAKDIDGEILLIRGLPGSNNPITKQGNLSIVDHLNAKQLGGALQAANVVLSRSGYTSVMDYIKLGVKAILVPTPGQVEQEYLANLLSNNKQFIAIDQDDFSLKVVLQRAQQLEVIDTGYDMDQYKITVKEFVDSLR